MKDEVRRITPDDVPDVVGLVHDLAEYERAPESCTLTEDQLHSALFSARAALFGHVATSGDEVVGCVIWFLNFSTWRGVHGIYLEDLYVQPEHRGRGLGRALLAALARECVDRGYGRLEWAVLDWNQPSIAFYRALGARPQDEWTTFRLDEDALSRLAAS
jgi:GNAT superfamily N-acetyltransferase